MKAIIKATQEAGSLQVADMPKPELGSGQVLVRIKAATLCYSDVSILNNKYVGRKLVPIPLIMGHEGAGVIEELGEEAKGLQVGDHVALEPISGCGHCSQCQNGFQNMCMAWDHIGITEHGVFAEYIVVSANKAHRIADNLDFAEAACCEPLGLVVRSLEQSKPMVGDTVAILGPGSLGLMHLLAYKAAGASKVIVIGLDHDRERFEIARNLGADCIVNLSKQDGVEAVMECTNGMGADIVVETASSAKATEMTVSLAASRGRVVLFGLYPSSNISPLQITRKGLTIYGDVAQVTRQYLRAISWMESGKVSVRELVKNRFNLDQASEAFEAAAKGNVPKVVFQL
jgi:threonine dehydrogenase-like Zn-dependent dehydrogenase